MKKITLVTGNANKLKEWRKIAQGRVEFESESIDLPEIQSLNSEEIAEDKAKRAYELLKKPVVVEDVSASLEKLKGLPGPFFKFFEQQLGPSALYDLAQEEGAKARISCTVVYYDGHEVLVGKGEVIGTVVPVRGEGGFGFDKVFVPDGYSKTFAEMTAEEKNSISHRYKAIKALLEKL